MANEINLTGGTYYKSLTGVGDLDITEGGRVRIQMKENTSGDTIDLLDEICPSDKVWKCVVSITITETDA